MKPEEKKVIAQAAKELRSAAGWMERANAPVPYINHLRRIANDIEDVLKKS